ncbi:MAG: hypothetical protein OES26_11880 [Gammaproteobacteria bacterium]|nr:hypothetical protein [Gammaproteobacteria bacterium]
MTRWDIHFVTLSASLVIFIAGSTLAPRPAQALAEPHECSFCHAVHGGGGFAVLKVAARLEAICVSCHGPSGSACDPTIPRGCAAPHQNYKANADYPAFRWTCRQCHDPHDNLSNWIGADHTDEGVTVPAVNIKLVGTMANTNLLTEPNRFDLSAWTQTSVTIALNATTDPMNNAIVASSTAQTFTADGNAPAHVRQTYTDAASTAGRRFNFWVWLKASADKEVEIQMFDGTDAASAAWTATWKAKVTTSWERFFLKKNVPAIPAPSTQITVSIGVDDDSSDGAPSGAQVDVWGAHLEEQRATAGIVIPKREGASGQCRASTGGQSWRTTSCDTVADCGGTDICVDLQQIGLFDVVFESIGGDMGLCDDSSANPGSACNVDADCNPGSGAGICLNPGLDEHSHATGNAWHAGNSSTSPQGFEKDGICEVCHRRLGNNSICSDFATQPEVCFNDRTEHNTGRSCTASCHLHADGFCRSCDPPVFP